MLKGRLKIVVLKLLSTQSLSGYNIIKHISEITGVKPSPGSVYPLLDDLHKNKLVTFKKKGRSKFYSLTKQGTAKVTEFNKRKKEFHNNIKQTVKLFSTLSNDKETKQMRQLVKQVGNSDMPFKGLESEVLQIKAELARVLTKDKKNASKAKRFLLETITKLKSIK